MTAATLLLYIALALLAQVLLGVAFALAKRSSAVQAKVSLTPPAGPVERERASAAWRGLRPFKVVRREYEDAAQTQCSFYLAPVDGALLPAFKPGQFLTFSLSLSKQGGGGAQVITRCYSLSDSPAPDCYRITIKRVAAPADRPELPPGQSSNFFHDHVQVGDTLEVRAPSGHFHIDDQAQTPAVLVAGGIGITPMMSMLRWCIAQQPQRRVHLYYGLRNGDDHAYKNVLQTLAAQHPQVSLHVAYSRPRPTDVLQRDYQHQGYVDIELLKQTLPHGTHQFYICGPSSMMESLVPALSAWGVANSDIHFEAFGPASVRLPADPPGQVAALDIQPVEVHFTRSGRTLQWCAKESHLLDFAEKHGIAVESGCRSGSCGSCLTSVVRGEVIYDAPPDFDLLAGQCLLCVGKPHGAITLEA
jgi:ferredoxin-NADP reductase